MERWEKLPEWLRWILCWPIIIIVSIVVQFFGLILGRFAVDRIWLPDNFAEMAAPVIGSMFALPVFFFAIQYLVPRKPHYVVFVWCVLSLVASASAAFMVYVDFTNDNDEFWWTVRDFVWALITLIMGVYFFFKIKWGYDVLE